MEEKKSNKGVLVVILVILVVACIGCGIFIGKNTQGNNTKKDTDTKQEEKKDEKKDEEIEDEDKIYEMKTKNHNGCGVCDEEGNLCCPVVPDKNTFDFLHVEGYKYVDGDINSDEKVIQSGDYQYKVIVNRVKGVSTVQVNGRKIFETPNRIDFVFVLDNGMIGIEYFDDIDQALLTKRAYFDTSLNLIRSVEGIKSSVSLFAKEYEVIERGNVCIDNKYVELKTNKVNIGSGSVRIDNVKTDKEENCAGLT